MKDLKNLKEHLDKMEQEVIEMRKIVISQDAVNKELSEEAWNDLMLASEEISLKWKGLSVLEEIKAQREK